MNTSIQKELSDIQKGQYGSDIRGPIYDALFKINNTENVATEIVRGGVLASVNPVMPSGVPLSATVVSSDVYVD